MGNVRGFLESTLLNQMFRLRLIIPYLHGDDSVSVIRGSSVTVGSSGEGIGHRNNDHKTIFVSTCNP